MTSPSVCAVILNWNRPAETLACLDALGPDVPVVVVDNGSQAEALEQLRAARPAVPLLALGRNLGYAGGNNAGIQWALERGYEWVLLLNDDAILASGALEALLETAQADPRVGFAGPLVLHVEPQGMIQSAGGLMDARWRSSHRAQDEPDRGQFAAAEPVDWITGCAILARAEMICQVGMLDERFFMYEEELEWCLRAKQAGWKVLFVPQARLTHAGVGLNYDPKPYITYYMARNHLLLLSKLGAGFLPWADALFQNLRTLAAWTLLPRWRDRRAHRDALWQGLTDYFRKRWGPMPVAKTP